MSHWNSEALTFWQNNQYAEIIEIYKTQINNCPQDISNYWLLGLGYLLNEQESEAQSTWLTPFLGIDEEVLFQQMEQSLLAILIEEACSQEQRENYQTSYLIRLHIREINPYLLDNLFNLIKLEFILSIFNTAHLNDWEIIEIVENTPKDLMDTTLAGDLLKDILRFPTLESIKFAEALLVQTGGDARFVNIVAHQAKYMANEENFRLFGSDLLKLCLQYQPYSLSLLKELFWNYALLGKYEELQTVGNIFYSNCETIIQKAFGSYQLVYTSMLQGDWTRSIDLAQNHRKILEQLIDEQPGKMDDFIKDSFIIISQPLLYLDDLPKENRFLINHIGTLFQRCNGRQKTPSPINTLARPKKLRIGYIGHTMRIHSVGWLSRWLINYHDHENFFISLYFLNQKGDGDEIQKSWFTSKADLAVNLVNNASSIIKKIEQDEIDILVDLDSFTFNITGFVMASKPAPIQVSWLGMDTSGIPTMDYFIADPYVLPDSAESYYQEKIWRLPNCYLGVDGFELDVPTLTRKDLDIPDDAIVYFNAQNALKRHPDTIHLQMKILKSIPNSFFVTKGTGDRDIMIRLFSEIAELEGVNLSRLRFLDRTPTEAVHRANLQIADVVLDTYPYNGATTTLEVLWLGIPIVTKVGEQFAARNSYTFMINAGITEGIAWSDDEYIEWGIKLGTDENLRKKVSWKLRQSRKTSPLWNGKQFARDMEDAYRQMWEIHCQQNQ